MYKDHIFREYDIRGVYETDFDLNFAETLGKAFVSFLKKHTSKDKLRLSIGYDARISSPDICKNLLKGFTDSGAEVYELGLITTPMSYFSMFNLELDGGIMVTGSHNPPDYNGFKLSFGRTTIFGAQIQELKSIIEEKAFTSGSGSSQKYDISESYVARYKSEFSNLSSDINVVLDCGNGAAGSIARKLYEGVGLKPLILFEEPDGTFPNHHPDPTVEENMADVKKAVKERGAILGIGFDGDADRIGIVDNEGQFILGDKLMILVARKILKDSPGAKIIGDVKCSDLLYTDVAAHGGEPIMWKTGHSLIKNKIKEEGAPFGGELSGHIFFSDRNYGYDDALYAGLRLIEILSESGQSMSELLEDLPKTYSTPEIRMETSEENKVTLVEKLQKHFREQPGDSTYINTIDGVRVSYEDGWALVRSSNTQPVITIRFESQTSEGLDRIQNQMMELINPLL